MSTRPALLTPLSALARFSLYYTHWHVCFTTGLCSHSPADQTDPTHTSYILCSTVPLPPTHQASLMPGHLT